MKSFTELTAHDASLASNAPLSTAQRLTMSSREIAELTGKRHPDVRRDIRNMLEQLEEGVSSFAQTYFDSQGKRQEEYRLPKDLTITLVSGYNPVMRHRIVTRWMELEEQRQVPQLPDFSNPAAAARAWAEQYEQAQLMLPKAEAYDRLINSDQLYSTRDAATILGLRSAQKLNDVMKELGWKSKRKGADEPLAHAIENGWLVKRTRGNGGWSQALLTPKGLDKLREILLS